MRISSALFTFSSEKHAPRLVTPNRGNPPSWPQLPYGAPKGGTWLTSHFEEVEISSHLLVTPLNPSCEINELIHVV